MTRSYNRDLRVVEGGCYLLLLLLLSLQTLGEFGISPRHKVLQRSQQKVCAAVAARASRLILYSTELRTSEFSHRPQSKKLLQLLLAIACLPPPGKVPVYFFRGITKLYIPSTLNIDFILWHTQLIVCAVKY